MKTIMLFGTFDGLHRGHIHVFQSAQKLADRVIIILSRDERVKELKGRLPIHTEIERKEILKSLKFIDEVILGHENDIYHAIKKYGPNIIGLGYDQKFYTDDLREKLDEFGLKNTDIIVFDSYKPESLKTHKLRAKLLTEM